MEIAVYISVHKNLIIFLSFRMHVSNAKQVVSKKRVTTMLLVEDIQSISFWWLQYLGILLASFILVPFTLANLIFFHGSPTFLYFLVKSWYHMFLFFRIFFYNFPIYKLAKIILAYIKCGKNIWVRRKNCLPHCFKAQMTKYTRSELR